MNIKKILHQILDIVYALVTLFLFALFKVIIDEGRWLPLREVLLVGIIWLIAGTGVYKLVTWLSKRKDINLKAVYIIGWLNLASWIIGFLGLVVSISTLALLQLLPDERRKFFKGLAYVSLLLSLSNMIAGVFRLDSYLFGLAGLGVGFLYILIAVITYVFSVRINKRKIDDQIEFQDLRQYKEKLSIEQLGKRKPLNIGIIIMIIVASLGLFYWYEIRPARIRRECSWVKKHSDAVPERPAMTQEEMITAGIIEDCESKADGSIYNIYLCQRRNEVFSRDYSSYKPYEPAKDWQVKATREEYEFCLHDKGL